MPGITLIRDCEPLFEKLFVEHGSSYQRTPSNAIGTLFLPGSVAVIVPTGFANPQYTRILCGIEANKSFFDGFVNKASVLAVYGARVPKYSYRWLSFMLAYREQYGAVDIGVAEGGPYHGCSCIFDDVRAECPTEVCMGRERIRDAGYAPDGIDTDAGKAEPCRVRMPSTRRRYVLKS